MRRLLYTLLLLFVCGMAYAQITRPAILDSTYSITFSDEFNGNRINHDNWELKFPWNQRAEDYVCRCRCDNNRAKYGHRAYRVWNNDTNNVKVSDGTIKLMVKKEKYEGEFWDWARNESGENILNITHHTVDYTTGMLHSKQNYHRGYYEIKFRLPKAKFPYTYAPFGANFWMYTGNCTHEIDGFEITNGQTRKYTANVHYVIQPTGIGADTVCAPFNQDKNDPYSHGSISKDDWHVAGFYWTADRIDYYLDGAKIHSCTQHWVDSLAPMPMIVDINAPKESCNTSLESRYTKFPYVFEIDYIRVWQRKED